MLSTTLAAWGTCTAGLVAAEACHRRIITRVPHRILVSGMRGKSTAVRLLHAGFQASGERVLGRITGDSPVHLMPDGTARPVRRWGPANIREMRRTARMAARLRCEALCIENMAIHPEYVRVAGTQIVRPTCILHVVDGTDHLEQYPADPRERACLVVSTWPISVPVVVVESDRNGFIIEEARRRGHEVIPAPPSASQHLRPWLRELAGAVGRAIALSTNGAVETHAIEEAASRCGQITVYRINDRPVVDLRSVNDLDSTQEIIAFLRAEGRLADERLVFLHRADRPTRLLSFRELLEKVPSVITGDPVPWTFRRRSAVPVRREFDAILREFDGPLVLVGNRHGTQEGDVERILTGATVESW